MPKPAIWMLGAFALFWSLVIVGALFLPEEQAPKHAAKTTTEQAASAETPSATTPKPKASKPKSTPPKTIPSARKPKPRPAPKPKRATKPDPAVKAQRFYLGIDDAAIALDDAIGQALAGDRAARAQIAQAKKRISARLTAHLLDGGDTSVGANLLLSAAAQAQEAIRSKNLARLADARREVAGARRNLAGELKR